MSRFSFLIISFLFIGGNISVSQSYHVTKAFRAGGEGSEWFGGLGVDSLNNVYFTGTVSFAGNPTGIPLTNALFDTLEMPPGSGGSSGFLSKYSSEGRMQWVKMPDDKSNCFINRIDLDQAGNSYISGYFWSKISFDGQQLISQSDNDFFVAKFNNLSQLVWIKQGKDPGTSDANQQFMKQGKLYLTGNYEGWFQYQDTTVNSSGGSIFLMETDTSGTLNWLKSMSAVRQGQLGMIWNPRVVANESGNVYLSGSFRGDSLVSSDFSITGAEPEETVFLVKYSMNGEYQWVRSFQFDPGANNSLNCTGLALFPDQDICIAGSILGNTGIDTITFSSEQHGMYFLKFDPSGAAKWVQVYDPGIYLTDFFISPENEIFFAGTYYQEILLDSIVVPKPLKSDIIVASIDSSGKALHAIPLGGAYHDMGWCLKMDLENRIWINGLFQCTTDLHQIHLETLGDLSCYYECSDIFLARLDRTGLSISENRENGFLSLYPNPASDKLTISIKDNEVDEFLVEIYDLTGRKIHTSSIENNNYIRDISVSLSGVLPGIYTVKLTCKDKILQKNFVKR